MVSRENTSRRIQIEKRKTENTNREKQVGKQQFRTYTSGNTHRRNTHREIQIGKIQTEKYKS